MQHVNEKKLKHLEFLNREKQIRHHRYDEEMLQYNHLKAGDLRAIDESIAMFSGNLSGHLSNDSLRNIKYRFIASITIATRYAIEGGMDEEMAYNASDLYIQEVDLAKTIEEVVALHAEMFTFFTKEMIKIQKKNIYSKPIIQCMDYIYYHLNEKITLKQLSKETNLNPNYLSELFHKELGMTFSDYLKQQRIIAAKNMLRHSDYDYSEIASILAFSSQSHFTKVFKGETGYTPKAYRNKFFRHHYI